jgi:hypothetical protein
VKLLPTSVLRFGLYRVAYKTPRNLSPGLIEGLAHSLQCVGT